MASALVPVALPGSALVPVSVPHVVQMPCAPVRRASVPGPHIPVYAPAMGTAYDPGYDDDDLQEHFQLGASQVELF